MRRIRHCARCNTFTENEVCELCLSPRRDGSLLCVVETPADLLMMEQTQSYGGLYFVLMGRLSPLDGIGPREIHLDRLLKRATDGVVKEVILATNFTVEGEATAHYVSEMFSGKGLAVSAASPAGCRWAARSSTWTPGRSPRRSSSGVRPRGRAGHRSAACAGPARASRLRTKRAKTNTNHAANDMKTTSAPMKTTG